VIELREGLKVFIEVEFTDEEQGDEVWEESRVTELMLRDWLAFIQGIHDDFQAIKAVENLETPTVAIPMEALRTLARRVSTWIRQTGELPTNESIVMRNIRAKTMMLTVPGINDDATLVPMLQAARKPGDSWRTTGQA
jgi:hypothetical protein